MDEKNMAAKAAAVAELQKESDAKVVSIIKEQLLVIRNAKRDIKNAEKVIADAHKRIEDVNAHDWAGDLSTTVTQ